MCSLVIWMKFLSSIGWRCCRDTRRRNLILRERWPFLFSIAKSYQDNEKGREGQINYSTSVCTWCGGEGCKQWVSFCSVPPSSVLNIDLELASFKLVIYVTGDAKVIKVVLKEREGAWVANESTSVAVRITLTITTTLLVMLLHAYASPVVLAAAVSKDETTCTMCDECHDPCAVPSSPPPPSPVIKECPPPPAPPSPPPPALPECPPPPPALPECPPPPPALPECPPPPQPPIQVLPPPCDVCGGTPSSSSPPPPRADVPSLLPDRPPLPPSVPGNPMAPPLYPADIFSPPQRPYPSKSVHSRMHSSCSTLASVFVLFTSSCFFFFF